MDSVATRLCALIGLRQEEARVATLMFAYSCLAMTSYNTLKPITRSQFIDRLGADNLPWVGLAAGFLIGILMHAYGRIMRRVPRRLVIPVTQSGIVLLLLVFWVLLGTEAAWVSVALYFFGLILGLLLISQFWMLANDIYDARQAKRLFGFIGGGASLGGALGAGLTAVAVQEIGARNLLLVSAAALSACVPIVLWILKEDRNAGATDPFAEDAVGGSREALRLLAESSHLRIVACVIALAAGGAAIIEQQLVMAAEAMRGAGGADSIAQFLAQVSFYVSAAGFIVQVALTSRIHRSLGLAVALLLLPVALGTTGIVILVTGALWAPAIAKVLDSTLRYSVDKTTREVLFLPLPAEVKYHAKPFIDVTMDRVAKAAAALLILVLIKPWGLGLDWRLLSYASLTVTAIWIVTALVARREYLRAFRHSIGARVIALDAIRPDVADTATVEALVEELSNPDESSVLYAIDMLEALDKRHLVTPLLLQHESPRVRARALLALAVTRSRIAVKWTPVVERMTNDVDVDVRAAALRALAALSREDAAAMMRRHLDDPEPRVAVAAAIALANSGRAEDVAGAESTLTRLIADTREAAAAGRREAAIALAHITDPGFRSLLVPLLHDRATDVVEEAIRSARIMGASDGLFLPGLMSLLGRPALKAAARDTLVGYGAPVIAPLAHALRDPDESVWIRRHIPSTLAQMASPASMDALVTALDDPDGFLRYKSIAALEKLRRDHPAINVPRGVIERLVIRETSRYYNCLTLQHNLVEHSDAARGSLIAQALGDKLHRTLDRIYRLLGLLHGIGDVAAARFTIEQGEPRRRAAAIEYLDNLLGGVVRKRVLPILDETPVAEKVRTANLVLKSRPRDLDDTLAQLIHDDDPVIAAAAIHFVARQRVWALADDLEYVVARRGHRDRSVLEAASWALALRQGSSRWRAVRPESLPIVEVGDRVRMLPLFEFASVDELFRIAEQGQEVHWPAGRDLCRAGEQPPGVLLVISGVVRTIEERGRARDIRSPAVLCLEDVLQGFSSAMTIHAVEDVVCFRLDAGDFQTMLADNVLLAEALFRMLLLPRLAQARQPADVLPIHHVPDDRRGLPLQPIDVALLLRHDPLLARASVRHLLAIVGIARDVPFSAGAPLFEADRAAAIYVVAEGTIALDMPPFATTVARRGATIGLAETLAGTSSGWRGTAISAGRLLRIERDELFLLLADHVELTRALFAGVLAAPMLEPQAEPVPLDVQMP